MRDPGARLLGKQLHSMSGHIRSPVIVYLLTSLRELPELAIFLTLAVGFVIGGIKIGSFKFGNVVGTLIAGVIIGRLDIKVDATVKSVSSRCSCLPRATRLDRGSIAAEEECDFPGRADGGPLRDEPGDDARGGEAAQLRHRDHGRPDGRRVHRINGDRTASDTIDRLDLPDAEKTKLKNNIPVAYAVSYLVARASWSGFSGRRATHAARRHEGGETRNWRLSVGGRRGVRIRKCASPTRSGASVPPGSPTLPRAGRWRIRASRETQARVRRTHPPRIGCSTPHRRR